MKDLLKATGWHCWDSSQSDQSKGLPKPEIQFPPDESHKLITLPSGKEVATKPLWEVLEGRRSRRKFRPDPLSLEELGFLLAVTQGITGPNPVLRAVPSAGARHPFETYLWVNKVASLEAGLYRYLPLKHQLELVKCDDNLGDSLVDGCLGQGFVGASAVTFIWVAVPYRTEWRYAELSPKLVAIDAGHLCQNVYIASESIGAGTCGIGAYHQEKMDSFVGVDGQSQFVIYIAPVGKI